MGNGIYFLAVFLKYHTHPKRLIPRQRPALEYYYVAENAAGRIINKAQGTFTVDGYQLFG